MVTRQKRGASMAVKSFKVDEELAKRIKARRNELGLTIEDAAKRAGVGVKTWCRYEAGEAIRTDKYKGVCKALNWKSLSDDVSGFGFDISKYYNHEAWSPFLAERYGELAAASFVIGSEILLDDINSDLSEISEFPKGSHLGQLEISEIVDFLPEQFLMHYDYEFLYLFKCVITRLVKQANNGTPIVAHTVLEELALYVIVLEADMIDSENVSTEEYDENWVFDLFGDMDIITFLYSDIAIDIDNLYHFMHWNENLFCI